MDVTGEHADPSLQPQELGEDRRADLARVVHPQPMDVSDLAEQLVMTASRNGQAVLRSNDDTPLEELREAVRLLARSKGLHVRTGMIGAVLAVVLADAELWEEPVSVMRTKLPTPITSNTVH